MKNLNIKAVLLLVAIFASFSATKAANVTQNFESGDMAVDVGNYWAFYNILYDKSVNYHINDNWVGKNTRISASREDTWIKSPWVKMESGDISFFMKLD